MNQVRRSQRNKQNQRAQRGVSLLEILIVLVILVVGILSVIRLFPSGFFSIESAGTAANADALGQELIQAQTQVSSGLPDAILPGQPDLLTAASASTASYDPDDPNLLDNARLVQNETITVPAPQTAGGQSRSLYTVNYGPIVLPLGPTDIKLSEYLTINSPYWKMLSGNSTMASATPPSYPQDTILPGQQSFLVDFAKGLIAIPYAQTYTQTFTMMVIGSDGNAYTLAPILPPSGSSMTVTDPHDPLNLQTFLPNTKSNYNGNWFAPTDSTLQYYDTANGAPASATPPAPWKAVMLYRPFQGVTNAAAFKADPYQFTLPNANFGLPTAPNYKAGTVPNLNLGVIQFNPIAAGGNGYAALKAEISYQAYDWQIIHEDRDIPALNRGDQYIARLTLKGLKTVGQAYPDSNPDGTQNTNPNLNIPANADTTYKGIAGSGQDVIVLDLDTGQPISASQANPASPLALNNEDANGTLANLIDVGHSVGRLVFQGAAFTDTTPVVHRVRIFYQAVGDWTVAMQKAPTAYSQLALVSGNSTDPQIAPAHCALDASANLVYFPRCDAGKTVEVDGISYTVTYTDGGATQTVSGVTSGTAAISPTAIPLGGTNYVAVDLSPFEITDAHVPSTATNITVTTSSTVPLTAVRGLSTRAVVAWKERNHWKVHTVDTVLTRAQPQQ